MTEPTKTREGDQALPTKSAHSVCVQDLIIAEMEESKRVGTKRYGSTLNTFNGRRSIQDVAEEVRDLHVYLTQVRAESEAARETLADVVYEALEDLTLAGMSNTMRKVTAKAAVDAVMGWVAGQLMQTGGTDV